MSRKKVIVKRLNAIQNFGGMDILCTDKTGTLTRGEPSVTDVFACDAAYSTNDVLRIAACAENLASRGSGMSGGT